MTSREMQIDHGLFQVTVPRKQSDRAQVAPACSDVSRTGVARTPVQRSRVTHQRRIQALPQLRASACFGWKNFSNRVVWRTIREYRPDIVDEAISTLLSQLCSFKGTSKFSTWAYSIIERICFHELRTKITIKKHEKSFSDFEDFEIEALLSYEPDTEAKATLDVLRQSLSSEENELIDLKLNGHTSVEIAEKLATTPTTIDGRLRRLFEKLRKAERKRQVKATSLKLRRRSTSTNTKAA